MGVRSPQMNDHDDEVPDRGQHETVGQQRREPVRRPSENAQLATRVGIELNDDLAALLPPDVEAQGVSEGRVDGIFDHERD